MIEPNFEAAADTGTDSGEGTSAGSESSAGSGAPGEGAAPSLTDLSTLQKFKFEGQEMSYEDLKNSYLRHQDYTRKTQEIAEERKYYNALDADLDAVRKNPALMTKFREIYPEKFHSYLRYLNSSEQSQTQAAKGADTRADLPPEVLSRIDQIENMVKEDKIQAIETKLEAQDRTFSEKYPMADIEAVYAKAQAAHKQGVKLTDEKWEQIWKDDQERHSKRYESHYKKQFEKQKEAQAKSKDTGAGGGTPGGSPQKVKLKDVADQLLTQGIR